MKFLSIVAALLLIASCGMKGESSSHSKSYGPEKVDLSKAMSTEEMVADFNKNQQSKDYTFHGNINKVCQSAGCWISVEQADGSSFMVRFKDHFTIPTNTELGQQAYMHGTAYMDTVSVAMQKHFAEDAGKSQDEIDQITEPKYVFGFMADGITLTK